MILGWLCVSGSGKMSAVESLPKAIMDGILSHLDVDRLRREEVLDEDTQDVLYHEVEGVQHDYTKAECRAIVDYEIKDKVRHRTQRQRECDSCGGESGGWRCLVLVPKPEVPCVMNGACVWLLCRMWRASTASTWPI